MEGLQAAALLQQGAEEIYISDQGAAARYYVQMQQILC